MECESIQTWLFRADTMQPECWPTDLADHVQGCPECSKLARELRRLEDDWRAQPLPAEAEQARIAFLRQLPELRESLKPSRRQLHRNLRWLAAAAILLAVGPFAYLMINRPTEAVASSEIVDKLIDLNIALASAAPADRKRIYAEREGDLRTSLQSARLRKEDRAIADKCLENGQWIAEHNDPVAEADHLSAIADMLVGRVSAESRRGDLKETERNYDRYNKIWERVNSVPKNQWEPEKKKGFEQQWQKHDNYQREQFQLMHDRAQPEMKKFFESLKKGRAPVPAVEIKK